MRRAVLAALLSLVLAPTPGCGGGSGSPDPGSSADVSVPGDALGTDLPGENVLTADTPAPDTSPQDIPFIGVDSLGGCSSCGLGSLVGVACAPDGKTPVVEVVVTIDALGCDGQPVHLETMSDVKGQYRLDGVPCGQQVVNLNKGSFAHTYNVYVNAGVDNEMSTGRCFKSAKLAVITGDWDQIQEAILRKLKLNWTQFNGTRDNYQEAKDLLTDYQKLKNFGAVFINCSDGMDQLAGEASMALKTALNEFVKNGGSIYASDYAGSIIEAAFPSAITWGSRCLGMLRDVACEVNDPPLIGYLGKNDVKLDFILGPIQSLDVQSDPDTMVHIDGYFSTSSLKGKYPTMVSFRPYPKGGRVVYTTFHNEEQEDSMSDLTMILNYVVFML